MRAIFWTWAAFVVLLLVLLLGVKCAHGQKVIAGGTGETDTQTTPIGGNTLTFTDTILTQTDQWELVPAGAPTGVTVTISGVMPGGTVTPLATSTATTATTVTTFGGPFAKYTVAVTLSGGASPTMTVNRLATAARNVNGPVNPASIGTGNTPPCYVNGSKYPNLLACALANPYGEIDETAPEYIASTGPGNPFASFFGHVKLPCDYLGTTADATHVIATITDWPLVLNQGTDLDGCGPVNPAVNFAGGTAIVPGPNAWVELGAPTAPTLGCGVGTLAAATYQIHTAWLADVNSNGGPATPMPSQPSPVASIACGALNQLTVTSPGPKTRTHGTAAGGVFLYLCTGASDCLKDAVSQVVGSGLTCPGGASSLNANTCDTTAGTMTVTAIATATTAGSTVPPLAGTDYTAPLIVLGTGDTTTTTTFATYLQNLTIGASSNGSSTPGASSPGFNVIFNSAQELSGLNNVWLHGAPLHGYGVTLSGNNHMIRLETGNGSNAGTNYGMIIDGRPAGTRHGGLRTLVDFTFALKAGATIPAQIYVVGQSAAPNLIGGHLEGQGSTDGILFDDGASGFFDVNGGVQGVGQGLVHLTTTAGNAVGFADNQENSGITANSVLDERFPGPCLGNTAFCTKITGPGSAPHLYTGSTSYGNMFLGNTGNIGVLASATYNVNNLGCDNGTGAVGDCGSALLNANFIGVLLPKQNGNTAQWQSTGIATIASNAAASFTVGHTVCTDTVNAAKVVDSGATTVPCALGKTVGFVFATDAAVLNHQVVLAR